MAGGDEALDQWTVCEQDGSGRDVISRSVEKPGKGQLGTAQGGGVVEGGDDQRPAQGDQPANLGRSPVRADGMGSQYRADR